MQNNQAIYNILVRNDGIVLLLILVAKYALFCFRLTQIMTQIMMNCLIIKMT
jgi:hypothetical protein